VVLLKAFGSPKSVVRYLEDTHKIAIIIEYKVNDQNFGYKHLGKKYEFNPRRIHTEVCLAGFAQMLCKNRHYGFISR
jgi:hypothetical protein